MPPAPEFDPDFATPAQWAAMYRRHGIQVVPSHAPHKKIPALAEWKEFQDNLVPQAKFDEWYGAGGRYVAHPGMGVLTGACSGRLFMIDLDLYKSAAALGWWTTVLAVHNNRMELETWTQITGGGGRQMFFRYPAGAIPNAQTNLDVDIRGQGGFAVLPPSGHVSGKTYAWMPGRAPDECPLLDAPDWLLVEVDRLINEHGRRPGGHAGPVGDGNAEPEFGGFGRLINGRERYMRDLIWAAMIGYKATGFPLPPGPIERDQVWADYERNAGPRSSLPGEDNAAGLEREGRGFGLFCKKWDYALTKWEADLVAASRDRLELENAQRASEPPKEPPPEPPKDPPKDDDWESAAQPSGPPEPKETPVKVLPAFPIDEASIPVRDWVVPGLLLRNNVSLLVAPPGSGKSLLTLQLAITVAHGATWGGWTPRARQRVLVINSEDDVWEMRRRLTAAVREMSIDQADLTDRVDLAEDPGNIVIARMDARVRAIVRTPYVEKLVETIRAKGYGLVVVDPFAETFEGDENSNSEVKWAAVLWREVARRAGCALLLVHHTKKYAGAMAGEADASRGGGALIGVARILCTLFDMTEDEATAMNIEAENRFNYVRFDDAKANHARKGAVRWFQKVIHTLGNATPFVPGDEVAVLSPWKPPGALDGISVHDIGTALDTIDRGVVDADNKPTGQFFTASATSKTQERWVGKVLMRMLECSNGAAKNLIKDWLKNDVLEVFDYTDPVYRKARKGVRSVLQNRPGKGQAF